RVVTLVDELRPRVFSFAGRDSIELLIRQLGRRLDLLVVRSHHASPFLPWLHRDPLCAITSRPRSAGTARPWRVDPARGPYRGCPLRSGRAAPPTARSRAESVHRAPASSVTLPS